MKNLKNPFVYIHHILDSIHFIQDYVKELTEEDFNRKTQVQDAVIRRFEIMGEAVSKLSKEFKEKYSNVPWRKVYGMRNFVIHEYEGIDLFIIWKTIKDHLPPLKFQMEEILKEEKS